MILAPHFIVGAVLGEKIHPLALGLISAFFSHYLLDSLPHLEYRILNIRQGKWRQSAFDFLKVFLDFSFGLLTVLLFSKNLLPSLLGGFIAIVPDGLCFLSFVFQKNKLLLQLRQFHHDKIHAPEIKTQPLPKGLKVTLRFWEITGQAIVILLAIFFLRQ